MLFIAIVVIVGLELVICFSDIRASVLMLDNEYTDISILPIRLSVEVLGFLWIFVMFRLVPKGKVKILTIVGQNTMPIYLIHGFIARIITHFHILHFGVGVNELLASIMALGIILIFGNAFFGNIMRVVF